MLQNNVIYEWIIAYKEPLFQKGSFLSLSSFFFCIKGPLQLSKEPYATYRTLFSKSVRHDFFYKQHSVLTKQKASSLPSLSFFW